MRLTALPSIIASALNAMRVFPHDAAPIRRASRVPDGMRVYAIGDIHGRVDLLAELQECIAEDRQANPVRDSVMIYLGDYVDRGMHVKQTIERLAEESEQTTKDWKKIYLIGNHELMMLGFLDGYLAIEDWIPVGGEATLLSYGVSRPVGGFGQSDNGGLRTELRRLLPPRHEQFLQSLALSHQIGDYFFVHAGIRPGRALHLQNPNDLTGIREPFLSATGDFGVTVVHGHSAEFDPVDTPHRIGVDTGAYATGRLTCVVLEGEERRFLATRP